jgi:hypothetical protein
VERRVLDEVGFGREHQARRPEVLLGPVEPTPGLRPPLVLGHRPPPPPSLGRQPRPAPHHDPVLVGHVGRRAHHVALGLERRALVNEHVGFAAPTLARSAAGGLGGAGTGSAGAKLAAPAAAWTPSSFAGAGRRVGGGWP